jgi:uncharacterized protein
MGRLERFRTNKNRFFKEHENSPLTDEQRERFQQLEYFPEDESLRFVVHLDDEGISTDPVVIGTTTGEPKELIPAGRAHFEVNGQQVSLMVYREPGRGRYFLPFRDATAGDETYDVGRYLDPQARPDGSLVLDFNMAYNPYCAYNDNFACPIPPFENILSVPIRAGEKKYPDKA